MQRFLNENEEFSGLIFVVILNCARGNGSTSAYDQCCHASGLFHNIFS